jgi:O-antigen ligase/tetratricopeptide (TPR) repeat protein
VRLHTLRSSTHVLAVLTGRSRSIATELDESQWRRAVVFLVAMKIAGLILVFDPFGLQAFALPKSVFSRVTAFALAAAVLAIVARFGPGVIPRTRLHVGLAGLLLANLISAIGAENPYVAVFGDQDSHLGLTFLLDMTVLYLAIAIAFRTVEDWAALLAAVGTASAFALGYATVQALGWDPIVWIRTVSLPSTFGQANVFGHFLSIAFGVSLGIAFVAGPSGYSLSRRAGFAAALVFAVFASVVATRGTLLGMAASLAVFAALTLRVGRRRPAKMREFAIVGAISLLVLLLIVGFTPLGARTMRVLEDEGSGRLSFYRSAVAATLARPVFGFGPDNFGVAYPGFREPPPHGPGERLNSAHNALLQASATTGVVGLLALVGVVASFGAVLLRVGVRRAPTVALPLLFGYVAYWTHALVTFGAIAVDWFPWLCYGAIAAMAAEPTRLAAPLRRRHVTFAAALMVISVAGLVVPWQTFQANRQAGEARAQWTRGRSESAILAAGAAVALDPGRAEYWNWLGLGHDQAGTPRRAAEAFEEAARRAPHETTYWLNLALARARQALAGDDRALARDAALTAAARAVAIDPNLPHLNQALTDIALELDDYDVALRSAVRTSLLLDGDAPSGHQAFLAAQHASDLPAARQVLADAVTRGETAQFRLALAQIAYRMNDRAEARRNALRALALKPGDEDALRLLDQLGP